MNQKYLVLYMNVGACVHYEHVHMISFTSTIKAQTAEQIGTQGSQKNKACFMDSFPNWFSL